MPLYKKMWRLKVATFYLKKKKRLPHLALLCIENLVFSSIYGNSTRNSHPIFWFVIRKPYFIWTLVVIETNTLKLENLIKTTTLYDIFLLKVNFDKSTIELHFFLIFFMLVKFLQNPRLVTMPLINCLNCKFL